MKTFGVVKMFEYEFHFLQMKLARDPGIIHYVLVGGSSQTLCGKHVLKRFVTGDGFVLPEARLETSCRRCKFLSQNLEELKLITRWEKEHPKEPEEWTTEKAVDKLGQKASQTRGPSRVR